MKTCKGCKYSKTVLMYVCSILGVEDRRVSGIRCKGWKKKAKVKG